NQTWIFDYSEKEWTRVFPATSPTARFGHNMVYDSNSDRVILYGGALGSIFYNDTWTYNCNSNVWSNMKPKTYPLATRDFNFAFDSQSDKAVMFGGISSTMWGNIQTQTYTSGTFWYNLDSNLWENVTTSDAPWGGASSSAWVYDSRNDVCIMFGGSTPFDDSIGDDTWWYRVSSNAWTEANSESIFDRISHTMVYSPIANRVILFGGADPGNTSHHYNDVWAYHYESNEWTQVETTTIAYSPSLLIISLEFIAVFLILKRRFSKK
ncbi:MAG: kelch repeat-containing protein, partial [Candidatus Thorarchaeota archaeon]